MSLLGSGREEQQSYLWTYLVAGRGIVALLVKCAGRKKRTEYLTVELI